MELEPAAQMRKISVTIAKYCIIMPTTHDFHDTPPEDKDPQIGLKNMDQTGICSARTPLISVIAHIAAQDPHWDSN
jgi:hypothetical protein